MNLVRQINSIVDRVVQQLKPELKVINEKLDLILENQKKPAKKSAPKKKED